MAAVNAAAKTPLKITLIFCNICRLSIEELGKNGDDDGDDDDDADDDDADDDDADDDAFSMSKKSRSRVRWRGKQFAMEWARNVAN